LLKKLTKKRPVENRNIVVFGQTGAGKSSVINMLGGPGEQLATVSGRIDGVTRFNCSHPIPYRDGCTYNFWDTPGLNESDYGTMSSQQAIQNLQDLIKERRVDLFIYCIRDRLVDIIRFNYELVWKNPHRGKAPILLVVTGLEEIDDMEEWWHDNEKTIKTMKMTFDGHACITSWKGKKNMYADKYNKSAAKIWGLVTEHCGPRHNVIVFGEAGAGKSSIVNMIVGKDVAKVSSGINGCTFENDAYKATFGHRHFVIYDTAGLNEGDEGRVSHWQAIRGLYTLIRQLDGVSLLIYCMRGRIKKNAKANWDLFNKVICGEKVPIIAIVTGLENYEDPGQFLRDGGNLNVFKELGMEPKDIGCVVSFKGSRNEFAEMYNKSQIKVRTLVTKHCLQKSWREDKDRWFAAIYSEAYNSGFCFTRSRLDYSAQMRKALEEFVKETGMEPDDTEKLGGTLVKAEKKFRRGFLRGLPA